MTKKHDIIWLDSVDSTNTEVARRISDIDNLSVLSARKQTAGRGQRGNGWSSAEGQNLTFSIVLKYGDSPHITPLRAIDQSAVNEVAALSVIDILSAYGIDAKIKWPNDIYVANRKICGILIENSIFGDRLATSVVGIGLNVNQTEFDPSLPNPVSMALCGVCTDPENLLEEFMDIFKEYCTRYLNITGGLSRLRKLYLAQMWKKDETARFTDYTGLPSGHNEGPMAPVYAGHGTEGKEFSGIIRGLSDVGNLLVEDLSDGKVREFGFKEIGYII